MSNLLLQKQGRKDKKMMGQDKIKRFIRKYPGYVLAVCVGQLFLSLAFLAVILFEGRALDNLRTAGEKQAEAAFSSVMHQMALAAEAEDLSVGQKKLILYGKAEAAMDSLAGTGLTVTHRNLLDGTVEGVSCEADRIFSVQYHPESSPGPHDSAYLFDEFLKLMESS